MVPPMPHRLRLMVHHLAGKQLSSRLKAAFLRGFFYTGTGVFLLSVQILMITER
jgi:hypothetical protein